MPIEEVDRVSGHLLTIGCIIRESDTHTIEFNDEESEHNDRSRLDYDAIFSKVIELDDSLELYINEIKKIPPPGYKEVERLIYQAKDGNLYAKNRIISMYLKIVVRIALWASEKFKTPIAEAIQYGNIGLVTALEKYEPSSEHKFSTYAPWWIRQNLTRETPTINPLVYFPVHVKDNLFALYEIVLEHYCEECVKNIICENLIELVMEKISVDGLIAQRYIEYFNRILSIDEILEENEEDFSDNGIFELEMIEYVDYKFTKLTAYDILHTLKERETKVLMLRYGFVNNKQRTLEEVGAIFNLTRERIRQIEAKALKKLEAE